MYVEVDGARLYVDVEGAGLVVDGARMREKPTLMLLHGGPGADHSIFKPAFSALSDLCQIIYYDHRGNGRSGGDDPTEWTLARWGDDVKALSDALGIEKPIVYGASFGGFVAQAYATRHPGHAGKLILASTAAHVEFAEIYCAFERVGGTRAREIAETYWNAPTAERRARYIEACVPLYHARPIAGPGWAQRAVLKTAVALHFNGPRNEQGRLDFRADLGQVRCPTLVMSGGLDPIMPPIFSDIIERSLPANLVRRAHFPHASHSLLSDVPEAVLGAIREFVEGLRA